MSEASDPVDSATTDAVVTTSSQAEAIRASAYETSHPVRPGEEWANALSHGLSAFAWLFIAGWLTILSRQTATPQSPSDGLQWAVLIYAATVIAVFTCSTLSHVFLKPPWLERFRAWDQATIYLMIVGTYTPIVYVHASDATRWPVMIAMWVAALTGFFAKVILNHRIDSISTVSYLLLGWFPALPLIRQVPLPLAAIMLAGGVTYSVGVWFLVHDDRRRYFHVVWHLMVFIASLVHAAGIAWLVIGQ